MAFDDDPFESAPAFGDGGMIRGWNGAGIEEAAAVVELEMPWSAGAAGLSRRRGDSQFAQCPVDLRGNGARRHGFRECVLPKITHQAAPRAFAVGQENCGD